MAESTTRPKTETLDELFGLTSTVAEVDALTGLPVAGVFVELDLNKTEDFPDHPYRVLEDHITLSIVEDIKKTGKVDIPGIARPLPNGKFQVVAGHRRKLATKLAGYNKMLFIVREMTDDEATIMMVRTNTQREETLPSEKAKAWKMRMDAESRQGARNDLTSTRGAGKLPEGETADIIGEDEGVSGDTIRRYVRLNKLLPELMDMVDRNEMGVTPASELAELDMDSQQALLETMLSEDAKPSKSQAIELKKLHQAGKLDEDTMLNMLSKPKPNQVEKFKLPQDRVAKYFPPSFTPKQMEDKIIELLESWVKRRSQQHER